MLSKRPTTPISREKKKKRTSASPSSSPLSSSSLKSIKGNFIVSSTKNRPPRQPKLFTKLEALPRRSDYIRQVCDAEEHCDAKEQAQLDRWQKEAEVTGSSNVPNFTFGLKALMATAEKRELEELCKHDETRERLRSGWNTIVSCFSSAVDAGADLEKIQSVIAFMAAHYSELSFPSGGRRPPALEEITKDFAELRNSDNNDNKNNSSSSLSPIGKKDKYSTIIEKIAAFDRLQMIECGRLEDPENTPSASINDEPPSHHRTNLQYSAFHFLQSPAEQSEWMLHFKNNCEMIRPNDDNSHFVRQSLELRQELTMARLQEKKQLFERLSADDRSKIQKIYPTFFLFLAPNTKEDEIAQKKALSALNQRETDSSSLSSSSTASGYSSRSSSSPKKKTPSMPFKPEASLMASLDSPPLSEDAACLMMAEEIQGSSHLSSFSSSPYPSSSEVKAEKHFQRDIKIVSAL